MTGSRAIQEAIPILDVGDLGAARLAARSMSMAIGFDERTVEEIALVVSELATNCLLYTSPSPRDLSTSRMPSSA